MKAEWEEKIQSEFPFMKQTGNSNDNTYRRWGFECSGGWYELLRDCCKQITDKYKKAGIEIDFVPVQVKERFGTLRFYYEFEDAPLKIAAFDFIGSVSVRFEPKNEADDEIKKNFRHDIATIVRAAEERSKHTCEICGKKGIIRNDLGWVRTLCYECYDARIKAIEKNKEKRADKKPEDYTG